LENLNLNEMKRLFEKFKEHFIIPEDSNFTTGYINYLREKFNYLNLKFRKIDADFSKDKLNLKNFVSASSKDFISTNNEDFASTNSAYQNIILKDTYILPAIVFAEIFLLVISFSILKNQMHYQNSILPVIVVAMFITICLIMDFWLLFSHRSPLKIKSLLFNTDTKTKKTSADNPPEVESFSTPSYHCSAKLTSQPFGSKEYDDSDKYYIMTEDFLIGSNAKRSDMNLKYPFIDDIHARITCKQGFYFVEDLGSQSGTYLNDTRLKKHADYELGKTAKLRFGNAVFYFSVNG